MNSQFPTPDLIVMLTHQDKTVPDALALFQRAKDYPFPGHVHSHPMARLKRACGPYLIDCSNSNV